MSTKTKTPSSYNYQGFNVTPAWSQVRYSDGGGVANTLFFNPADPTQKFSVSRNSGILNEIVTNRYNADKNNIAYGERGGSLDISNLLDYTDNGGGHFSYGAKPGSSNVEQGQGNNLNIDNFQAEVTSGGTKAATDEAIARQEAELARRNAAIPDPLAALRNLTSGSNGIDPNHYAGYKNGVEKYFPTRAEAIAYSGGTGTYDVLSKSERLRQLTPAQAAAGLRAGTITEDDYNQVVHGGQTLDANGNVYNPRAQNGTSTGPTGIKNVPSQGFTLTGGNLKYGSSGDDVKKLQQYLQGLGIYQGKVDGIFGPQTQQSVQKFQTAHGLKADGVVGPKTVGALQSAQGGQGFPTQNSTSGTTGSSTGSSGGTTGGTTYNTGDPAKDALLKQLQDFIKAQQDAGLKINPALNFDQATLDKFLETAKKQVDPYYTAQIDNIKADVLRAAPQILQNYESDLMGKENNFQNTLNTSRENDAGAGLAFSGQRAKSEFGMQDAQNRDLASLSQAYGNKLYDLGNTAESKIGSSNANFNLGALKNYSANLSGNGGFTLGDSSTPYKSGGYGTGSLQYEQEAAREARRQALLKSASESVVAGRSYQDLFK